MCIGALDVWVAVSASSDTRWAQGVFHNLLSAAFRIDCLNILWIDVWTYQFIVITNIALSTQTRRHGFIDYIIYFNRLDERHTIKTVFLFILSMTAHCCLII